MKTRFLTPARNELNEAIAHYNKKREGLGFRFSDEIKITIQRIVEYPEAWSKLSKATRHCHVKGFPYSVIYYLRGDELVIIAVMHNRREPDNWRSRISGV